MYYIGACILFIILNEIADPLIKSTGYKRYFDMSALDAYWFRSYIITDIHHIFVLTMAYFNHFHGCTPGSEFPVDDGTTGNLYLNSEICFF